MNTLHDRRCSRYGRDIQAGGCRICAELAQLPALSTDALEELAAVAAAFLGASPDTAERVQLKLAFHDAAMTYARDRIAMARLTLGMKE